MENKINIAELLKNCPKGMELNCALYEDVYFDYVDKFNAIHCYIQHKTHKTSITFNQYGRYSSNSAKAKCVIFPKDKNTWEGFVPPCQFKDGDILATDLGSVFFLNTRFNTYDYYGCYVGIGGDGSFHICEPFAYKECCGLATEEEKQIFFDALKDKGYKWNEETKTLDELNISKEEDKGNISDGYHTFNELYEYRLLYNASMFNELAKQGLYDVHKSKRHSDGTIPFGDENWFIVQAELPTGQISNHYEMKDWDLFQVREKEKANAYDGHTPQDVAKRLRMFLTLKKQIEPKFKVGDRIRHKTNNKDEIYEISKVYNDYYEIVNFTWILYMKYQDYWELVPNKFDINTLKPFKSKVLIRGGEDCFWKPAIFGFYNKINFYVLGGNAWSQCIPYKDNEHLLGTTDDCDEFYKNW